MTQIGLRQPRRWAMTAVTVIGVLITLSALFVARHPRGVYWSRVDVQLLVPFSSTNPNVIKITSSSLVATAGAIARAVDPSGGKQRLADQDVTLASEGLEHGSAVTLPNAGGQWSNSFAEPSLQVEAVGTTPDEVTGRMTTLLREIRASLDGMQPTGSVRARDAITLLDTPAGSPPIYFQPASRTRALAGIALLGVAVTVLARLFTRRVLGLRERSEPPASTSTDVTPRALATTPAP